MRVTGNIATMPSRERQLKEMLSSIEGQFDEVRVCLNGYASVPHWLRMRHNVTPIIPPHDLTDNGKYYALDQIDEHEIYFTLDDDIVYPPDYVPRTLANLDKYGCIITYHGRLLCGKGLRYYKDHQFYGCLNGQDEDIEYDVAGTGVTAFSTEYFWPRGLSMHPDQRMSDLLFSLAAARAGKTIGGCSRSEGWFKLLDVDGSSIWYDLHSKTNERHTELADEIYDLTGRSATV